MESTHLKYIGIDPAGGSERLQIAIFNEIGALERTLVCPSGELYPIITEASRVIVAVNSPMKLNNGKLREARLSSDLPEMHIPGRNVDMRVAEFILRAKGIHVNMTPSISALCTQAVRAGFEVYAQLEKAGYSASTNSDRAMVESNAHAVFCALAGMSPLTKLTLEGRLQRQLLLFDGGLQIKDPMEFLEEVTRHKLLKGILPWDELYTFEELDAMAMGLMAYYLGNSEKPSIPIGDLDEGMIYLPTPQLLERY